MHLWIDQPDALRAHFRAWQSAPELALDTEFIRERTFYPQLALVQIAVPGEVILVDPLAAGVADVLREHLGNPAQLKLMHSASEDLQALLRGCQVLPEPLFDTQTAAALCGYGAGLGYQKLVQELTGVALEKGETRSDWMRRPLSESQRHYAADDVRFLHALHARLQAELQQRGRLDWLRAECTRALDSARDDSDDPWPHLVLRSAQNLDREGQARLCRLLRWRDAYARRQDRPRSWILDNELALLLAQRPPTSLQAVNDLFARHPKAPRKLAAQVLEALETPLPDEAAMPLAAAPVQIDKQRLKRLQEEVAAIAGELDIPEGMLCARRHLERLLSDGQWPVALGGWRQDLLRARLLAL